MAQKKATPVKKGGTSRKQQGTLRLEESIQAQSAAIDGLHTRLSRLEHELDRLRVPLERKPGVQEKDPMSAPQTAKSGELGRKAPARSFPSSEAVQDRLVGGKICVVTEDGTLPSPVVPHDAPFRIQLTLDLKQRLLRERLPCSCEVAVQARRLGGGGGCFVSEPMEVRSDSADPMVITLDNAKLSPGLYRLDAVATLTTQQGQRTSAQLASGLLNVY